MKRAIFVFAIFLTSCAAFAQTTAKWSVTEFDFGKIKKGVPVTHEFRVQNTGKEPLIITDVRASCGCTTPGWTKDPIPSGGEGYVKATFNAANVGVFNKSVTVTANVGQGTMALIIKGEVLNPTDDKMEGMKKKKG